MSRKKDELVEYFLNCSSASDRAISALIAYLKKNRKKPEGKVLKLSFTAEIIANLKFKDAMRVDFFKVLGWFLFILLYLPILGTLLFSSGISIVTGAAFLVFGALGAPYIIPVLGALLLVNAIAGGIASYFLCKAIPELKSDWEPLVTTEDDHEWVFRDKLLQLIRNDAVEQLDLSDCVDLNRFNSYLEDEMTTNTYMSIIMPARTTCRTMLETMKKHTQINNEFDRLWQNLVLRKLSVVSYLNWDVVSHVMKYLIQLTLPISEDLKIKLQRIQTERQISIPSGIGLANFTPDEQDSLEVLRKLLEPPKDTAESKTPIQHFNFWKEQNAPRLAISNAKLFQSTDRVRFFNQLSAMVLQASEPRTLRPLTIKSNDITRISTTPS